MLYTLTIFLDSFAMAATLWLALYLFGRGFPSRVTMRAVVVFLSLSAFFMGAYLNVYYQTTGTAAYRATLIIISLTYWFNLTGHLLPDRRRKSLRWLQFCVYALAITTAYLILSTRNSFIGEQGNMLYVARMSLGFPYTLYGIFQLSVVGAILYNLLSGNRVGFTPQGRYFLIASIFPALGTFYGILALAITPPLPRFLQDGFIFAGVFLFGISVARYQTLVERRTTLQDFFVSGLSVLALSGLYTLLAWMFGFTPSAVGYIAALAVLTHSIYDLAREFLDRVRIRNENVFRKQLRDLSLQTTAHNLNDQLQEGLVLLCRTLNASSGFIALKDGEFYKVTASEKSLPRGETIPPEIVSCDDISALEEGKIPNIFWLAPIMDEDGQIGVIGIGNSNTKLDYSSSDLDLLADVADRAGVIVSMNSSQPERIKQIESLVAEAYTKQKEADLVSIVNEDIPADFIKNVEEALRHISDYVFLGQSTLATILKPEGATVIERGKKLNQMLGEAIEVLRPRGERPKEPLPRLWFNYVVLHDAYVEGVQNREIMARLYISEGTFNRTRRSALRGLARALRESNK